MGCSGLLILGLFMNVAHCLEILDQSEEPIEIKQNVTAVLGEVVYLSCRYLGDSAILSAKWIRQINSKVKSKGLAGFSNGQPFNRGDFLEPESVTNLTVQMKVSNVDVEGEYICEFEDEEASYTDRAFVTVLARPDVQILVNAETINGTHFQSVSCSAIGGRPSPQISWVVPGRAPSDYPFTVSVSNTAHSNGTFTQQSILRFPTHLQEEDSVTCVVQHPTLPNPKLTTVRVETYTRPNVTIKAEMVQRGGNEFWVVSCISSGGRPDTDISLALSSDEELERENGTDSDMQRSSVFLPAAAYEGHNVTCVFDHPKFTQVQSRAVTLPTFYLTGVRLLNSETRNNDFSDDFKRTESLELQEGERGVVIGLEVVGNLRRYNITCKKDDGPLPTGLELVGSSLTVQGSVEFQLSGLYECVVSYHHLKATLQINITVHPHVTQPVPPTIRVDLQTKGGHRVIECSAADAVPAANVSWLLPKGVSGASWSNFTSHNGSHSVRGVFLLPACSPSELTAECVINHPAFEEPETRSITLPLCARTNITINSSTEWKDGEQFTKVDCSADSVASAAAITWHVGNSDESIMGNLSEPDVQADGSVSARSSVHFLSSLYAGLNLTCTVEHPSLEASERRTVHVPVQRAPLLSVSVVRQRDSHLWLGVCACRGEADGTNLTWVLPENAKGQTSLHSEYEGRSLRARLTYQFPLALHEGQDLTCVYQFKHGITEKRTVHIPRYYISAVRVLNRTTPLLSRYGGEPVIHRLALQENDHNQKILLRVEGNVPQYDLSCKRSDGSLVYMEGLALLFPAELTERDEGLYTCCASFYHHMATVKIQVEVTSKYKQFALAAMTCVSAALALIIILTVTLWVCCTRNRRNPNKGQELGSPAVKKPAMVEKNSKEYTQLLKYSIIIDVRSAV
ncbi:uncharacterized protein si:ch211-149e23.4 [Hippoglossus hippoglossus]|uniref:uncharacterized protein si:ch211-149e23.4 n=1 Tax=Hippoglossus hippoglossus TaxID=8267 RepID=UPI00148C5966|nr:uncharacterized protein si:ch211-149e23.4 [Hippoglossus hippoglossus]